MRDLPARRRRARLITAIVAVLIAVPLIGMYVYGKDRLASREEVIGKTGIFLFQDEQGGFVSHPELLGKLTIVAFAPKDCPPATCEPLVQSLRELGAFAHERLLYGQRQVGAITEQGLEKTPVRLWAFGVGPGEPWRRLKEDDLQARTPLLPPGADPAHGRLVIINQDAAIVWTRELPSPSLLADLKPVLSQLTINHYMRDYLNKRTFFRREPKTDDAPPPVTH